MKHLVLKVKVIFTLTNMTLAKGHLSKTNSQAGVLRTISPLAFFQLFIYLHFEYDWKDEG